MSHHGAPYYREQSGGGWQQGGYPEPPGRNHGPAYTPEPRSSLSVVGGGGHCHSSYASDQRVDWRPPNVCTPMEVEKGRYDAPYQDYEGSWKDQYSSKNSEACGLLDPNSNTNNANYTPNNDKDLSKRQHRSFQSPVNHYQSSFNNIQLNTSPQQSCDGLDLNKGNQAPHTESQRGDWTRHSSQRRLQSCPMFREASSHKREARKQDFVDDKTNGYISRYNQKTGDPLRQSKDERSRMTSCKAQDVRNERRIDSTREYSNYSLDRQKDSTRSKEPSSSQSIRKSQNTSSSEREKLRKSKRMNEQNALDNTCTDNKKIKISDKPEEKEDVFRTVNKIPLEPKTYTHIRINEHNHNTNLHLKDKFKATNSSIQETPNKVKYNQASITSQPRGNPQETFCSLKKLNINEEKINQTNDHSKNVDINTKDSNCFDKETSETSNSENCLNGVQDIESSFNTSDRSKDSSEPKVPVNTQISGPCNITASNAGKAYSDELQNKSILYEKCQNLTINYVPLSIAGKIEEDSQNDGSSETNAGVDINPLDANLREFDILDEVEGSEDEEGVGETLASSGSNSEASGEEEVAVDDIDAMLEEGLPKESKSSENKTHKKLKHKVLLEEIGHDHFDLLPEGWIQIIHNSGMPVYLQQKSRVCTMSRPYFLGPGSARSHKIPLSAIPCLQYKRALEIEKKYTEENKVKTDKGVEGSNENQPPLMPVISAKIETAEENEAAQSLEPAELQDYCKAVFNFKTISIIPFKSWGDRRKFARMTKDIKKQQRPLLPSGTKLLKFPIHNPDGTISKPKGEWVINPNGKSYVCILHEYVQQALRQHPKYQFKELKNPATPYSATVYIGEMQYGTGMGGSKKQAKLEAAKAALEVLIPEMKDKIEKDGAFTVQSGSAKKSQNYENSIFDQIHIEDPRVAEFCAKTTEPPPYAILSTCLQRNGMALDEVKVEYNMNSKRHKEDEFTMTVRNHTVTVLCKNKRDGKQKAAQAILKALHPNIEHFGSLLRMYGNHSIKSVKEKKQEEQEITGLQCKAAVNQPNYAILNKLKEEMLKLAVKRKEQQSKGKFLCHRDLLLPSASTTDLNKINL